MSERPPSTPIGGLALAEGWMAGAVADQLAFVGPSRVLEIAIDGDADVERAIAALAAPLDAETLAEALDATSAELAELLDLLVGAGALVPTEGEPVPTEGEPVTADGTIALADALPVSMRGERLTAGRPAAITTADELLVLPEGLTLDQERRALHSFVAGMTPDARLQAYSRIAVEGLAAVAGDRPLPELLAARLGESTGSEPMVRAIGLRDGATDTVAPDRLGEVGCERPHRLGPIGHVAPLERPETAANSRMHVYVARYAVANLRFPEKADGRLGGGRASDAALAELIARAEAAERYASGDLTGRDLLRASENELDAPFVTPDRLYRGNDRQRAVPGELIPYIASDEHLWIAGTTPTGERRWLTADAVFYPFHDPQIGGRTLRTSSSGSAAHTTLVEARTRAICELVERDAFMWTWIQRVERERIEERSLPPSIRDRLPAIRADGRDVAFVNFTIDLLPVVVCVIHSRDIISLATACSLDPAEAAERALNEAVGLTEVIDRGRLVRVEPEDVRTPEQHAALHLDPERIERDCFLYGSDEQLALDEIELPDASMDELVGRVTEPVTVDLSSPSTAPFAVTRVVVPDILPVSFGYDREPLGMRRLAEPKRTHDGRLLGVQLDLADVGPLDPHPFA